MAIGKMTASQIIVTSVLSASLVTGVVAAGVVFGTQPENLDADQTKVVELNKILTSDESKNGKNEVVGEAIGDFTLNNVTSYLPKLKGNTFYWTKEDNRVLIVTKDQGVTYPSEYKTKYESIKESSIPSTWHDLKDGCDHYWGLDVDNHYKCDYCHEKETVTPVLNETVEYGAEAGSKIKVEDFGGGLHEDFSIDTLACKYTFSAVDTSASAKAKGLDNYYVDFLVSFSRKDGKYAVNENNEKIAAKKASLGLWGSYGTFELAFYLPKDMKPNEKTPLISLQDGSYFWNYNAIVSLVNTFSCGAFNCSEENAGLTMSVDLCMWDKDEIKESKKSLAEIKPAYVVETYEYTFTSKVDVSSK